MDIVERREGTLFLPSKNSMSQKCVLPLRQGIIEMARKTFERERIGLARDRHNTWSSIILERVSGVHCLAS
jgi:hypothetical protein